MVGTSLGLEAITKNEKSVLCVSGHLIWTVEVAEDQENKQLSDYRTSLMGLDSHWVGTQSTLPCPAPESKTSGPYPWEGFLSTRKAGMKPEAPLGVL